MTELLECVADSVEDLDPNTDIWDRIQMKGLKYYAYTCNINRKEYM
jgi:hypothetical protein